MSKLTDYIKVYPMLSKSICNKAIKELDDTEFEKGQYHNPKGDRTFSIDKEADMSFEEFPSKQIIMDKLYNVIGKYIKQLRMPWYAGWNGYTPIRVNKYSKGQNFNMHCDHIHNLFDGHTKGIPILSIVGVLNDNYNGGEFVMWKNKTIKLKQGDVVMFPSNFMYAHKVNSIKKGTRYSFVSWVW